MPSPGDLPNSGIEPRSSTLQADSLPVEPPGKPRVTPEFQLIVFTVETAEALLVLWESLPLLLSQKPETNSVSRFQEPTGLQLSENAAELSANAAEVNRYSHNLP